MNIATHYDSAQGVNRMHAEMLIANLGLKRTALTEGVVMQQTDDHECGLHALVNSRLLFGQICDTITTPVIPRVSPADALITQLPPSPHSPCCIPALLPNATTLSQSDNTIDDPKLYKECWKVVKSKSNKSNKHNKLIKNVHVNKNVVNSNMFKVLNANNGVVNVNSDKDNSINHISGAWNGFNSTSVNKSQNNVASNRCFSAYNKPSSSKTKTSCVKPDHKIKNYSKMHVNKKHFNYHSSSNVKNRLPNVKPKLLTTPVGFNVINCKKMFLC